MHGPAEREAVSDGVTIPPASNRLQLHFGHGLGDAANWARALHLWRKRGYSVEVKVEENKAWLWQALGYALLPASCSATYMHFPHPAGFGDPDCDEVEGNKTAWNLGLPPMPDIGTRQELWKELTSVRLSVAGEVGERARRGAAEFLKGLPEPIILLHTHGSTWPESKSLPDQSCLAIYDGLLDELNGSLVLLDWDYRVPRLAHGKVRHLKADWGHIGLEQLAALMLRANLLVGVDSGPLHYASLFPGLRTLGLWTRHLPWQLALRPNCDTVHLVPHRAQNPEHRWNWHLLEWADPSREPGAGPDPNDIVLWARTLLSAPRFLAGRDQASDLVFQNLVRRMRAQTPLSCRADRNITMTCALERLAGRREPLIVETGCVRSPEDWGAGYFSYVMGSWLWLRGNGHLISIDNNLEHLAVARQLLTRFGQAIELVHEDSVAWLRRNQRPMDLLYLDSLDTEHPRHAEHCLEETMAAADGLNGTSLLLIDDTPWDSGGWKGKGRLAVPWLLEHGWRIVKSGYQVLLEQSA